MPRKPKLINNKKDTGGRQKKSASREVDSSIRVNDVRENIGVAIGANAKSTVIQVGSLFDFGNIRTVLRKHWLFLLINLILQFLAVASWNYYRDRFLIPQWVLLGGMTLLEIGLVSFYILILSSGKKSPASIIGALSFLSLAGLTLFEYNRVVHPQKFDRDVFGVAIAHFGEGPEFENTVLAQQVSQTVLERLEEEKQAKQGLEFVQFRQIGLVRNGEDAIEDGNRVGADLVIWGQLLQTENVTSIKYTVLDSDQIPAPNFQRVIPLLSRSISDTIFIPSKESKEIAAATTAVSGFTFGMAHFSRWDFPQAEQAFAEALDASRASGFESNSDLYLLYFYHGVSMQWPGNLEGAIVQFEEASRKSPDDPAALLGIAYSHRSLGNDDEARKYALQAYQLIEKYRIQHPDDPYAYYDRALANIILEDWEHALEDYEEVILLQPDSYIAHIGKIRMNVELNQLDEAIQAAEQAILLAESSGISPEWAYFYLADAHSLKGDSEQARLAYQTATALGYHIDWIHFQAGQFYETTGDFNAAEGEYKAMLQVTSNPAWAYSTLGDYYLKFDLTTDAIHNYQEALRLNPRNDGLWIALADAYTKAEQFDQADQAFQEALETAARQTNLNYDRFQYGNFLYSRGKYEEAVSQWEAALSDNPDQCELMLNLGLAYEKLEQREKARDIYARALSFDGSESADCNDEARVRLDRILP